MATSNQTIYELSRDSIIKAAMRKLGVLAKGQTPDSEDLTNGMVALNSLVAGLQGLGMTVWKRTTTAITPVLNTMDYQIGKTLATDIPFPLRIEHAYMLETATGIRTDMSPLGRQRFDQLKSLSNSGRPVQYTYQPKINRGVLSVWPAPDATTVASYTINIYYRAPFEGFTAANETPDFPQEWQNVLVYGLAVSLAPEFGIPLNDRSQLLKEYAMFLDMATGVTEQDESIFFQVNTDGV